MTTAPQQPVKIPLYSQLANRGESANVDARIINGYLEKLNEEWQVVKRPGVALYTDFGGGSIARGIYYYNGHVYAVVGTTFYKDSVAKGTVVGSGRYSFSSCLGATPVLFLHNMTNFYTYNEATDTLAAVGAPPTTTAVYGQAFVDGTTYVMDTGAAIFGSDINDPTTWDPLNVIKAQNEPDQGIALVKQLYYVVALKEWTCESFWDAGKPTGSPLQASQGSLFFYGCRSAGSIAVFENSIVWVTATRNGTSSVLVMEGLKPKIVSNPAVERLLQEADFSEVYAWAFRINGHRFYVLSLINANLTLVYDLTTDGWSIWTDANGNYLPFVFSTTTSDKQTLVQHANGNIYRVDETEYSDDGGVIPFEVYTPNWDGGTSVKKYAKRMTFHTDQLGAGTLFVRNSDDDYKSWTNPREVDLSRTHPLLDNCGAFRKRAWHLRYITNGPLRMRSVELLVDLGSL